MPASILQLAGIVAFVVAGAMTSLSAFIATSALSAVYLGLAMERDA
jgi:hypothetical protein